MRLATAALAALMAVVAVMASAEDDLTSLSYISYVERYATVQPASQESSLEAITNMPLVAGDRIDTAREARVEAQLADTSVLWLDEYSSVSFDTLANSRDTGSNRTVIFLAEGTIIMEVPKGLIAGEQTRIDGASETVYLAPAGLYRIEAASDGGLRVEVWSGEAWVSTPEGGVQLAAGSAALVRAGRFDRIEGELSWGDDFSSWVELRRNPVEGDSAQYTDLRYSRQASVLDSYGTWVYVPDHDTWGWLPTVTSTWRPYTWGRWYWTPTGWSWISYEPWGWMPYHYGSWYFHASHGWMWFWDPYWGPAWVDWLWWPGHIGWCPRGFYSYHYWDNWHHHHDHHQYAEPPQGGHNVVPRDPRRDGRNPGQWNRERPVDPARFALDLRGRTRLDQVDPRGWNVVATDDFDSPHLGRLVRPGERALPRSGEDIGIVRSGPLRTEAPTREAPRLALRETFRRVEEDSPRDISSLMSRSRDLDEAEASRLARPTTTADLASRAASDRPEPIPTQRRLAAAGGGRSIAGGNAGSSSSGGGSSDGHGISGSGRATGTTALSVSPSITRETLRNVHRPVLPSSTSGHGVSTSIQPSEPSWRGSIQPPDRSTTGSTRSLTPEPGSSLGSDRSLRGVTVAPSVRRVSPDTPSTPSTPSTPRTISRPDSGSGTTSPSPIIVPRTSSRSRSSTPSSPSRVQSPSRSTSGRTSVTPGSSRSPSRSTSVSRPSSSRSSSPSVSRSAPSRSSSSSSSGSSSRSSGSSRSSSSSSSSGKSSSRR